MGKAQAELQPSETNNGSSERERGFLELKIELIVVSIQIPRMSRGGLAERPLDHYG